MCSSWHNSSRIKHVSPLHLLTNKVSPKKRPMEYTNHTKRRKQCQSYCRRALPVGVAIATGDSIKIPLQQCKGFLIWARCKHTPSLCNSSVTCVALIFASAVLLAVNNQAKTNGAGFISHLLIIAFCHVLYVSVLFHSEDKQTVVHFRRKPQNKSIGRREGHFILDVSTESAPFLNRREGLRCAGSGLIRKAQRCNLSR